MMHLSRSPQSDAGSLSNWAALGKGRSRVRLRGDEGVPMYRTKRNPHRTPDDRVLRRDDRSRVSWDGRPDARAGGGRGRPRGSHALW